MSPVHELRWKLNLMCQITETSTESQPFCCAGDVLEDDLGT